MNDTTWVCQECKGTTAAPDGVEWSAHMKFCGYCGAKRPEPTMTEEELGADRLRLAWGSSGPWHESETKFGWMCVYREHLAMAREELESLTGQPSPKTQPIEQRPAPEPRSSGTTRAIEIFRMIPPLAYVSECRLVVAELDRLYAVNESERTAHEKEIADLRAQLDEAEKRVAGFAQDVVSMSTKLDRRTQLLRDVIDCEDKSMKLLWGVLKRIHAEIDSGKATP